MNDKLLGLIETAAELAKNEFLLIDDIESAINYGIARVYFNEFKSADFLAWCESEHPNAYHNALDIANQYGHQNADDIADDALYFVVGEHMNFLLGV
jgi:hypothetical protein